MTSMTTIVLLIISNIFMTFAWYGHLKYREAPLFKVILVCWLIAFAEYCFQVPANRIGSYEFSAVQLKTIQEVITLVVFSGFSVLYLGDELRWNYFVGLGLMVMAVWVIFKKWQAKKGNWNGTKLSYDPSCERPASPVPGSAKEIAMTRRLSSCLSAACAAGLFLGCPAFLRAQGASPATPAPGNAQSQGQSESLLVIRSTVRLVLVDVIVDGKHGEFVPDLKAEDFTVLEDGKPQRIAAFNAHRYQAPQPGPPLKLPPHQFTNFAAQDSGGAVTIVLLDTLNTPMLEQVDARKAMSQFLEKLPPGQRVALFVLSDHPKLVQGFTGSSDVLVAAARTLRPGSTPYGVENQADTPVSQALFSAFPAQMVLDAETRLRVTLASMKMLARAVSGYPGRKNVLWLSGRFPLRLSPEFTTNNHSQLIGQDQSEVLETAALLAASQIAVYPIDVTGLSVGMSIRDRFAPDVAMAMSTADDKRTAMEDIARETGGDAFYGTNAVNDAMVRGLKHGSDYYTLAYTPANRDWNGRYRKIEVKASLKGARLTFRRGYYANQDKEFSGDVAARMLATAMQPTVPESTMLLVKVQVLLPDSEHKSVRIDYAVDAHDIRFTDTEDQRKHVAVDFMATAWDKDFKDAGYTTDVVDTAFRPEAYQQVLQTGFPAHQELDLKPGTYMLRVGVLDRGSQKIGTVDVPITIASKEGQGN